MNSKKEMHLNCLQLQKGDESMEMTMKDVQVVDVNYILAHGKTISSQEALTDIAPVNWSDDVLDGKYKGKNIVKLKDEEEC